VVSGLCHSGGRAVRILAVCALVAAVGCGGESSDSGSRDAETVHRESTTTTPKRASGPTRAILQPIGDSTASGIIAFRKKPDGTPLVKIRLKGLRSASDGTRYVFWQLGSRHDMVVFAGYLARSDGRISRKIETATEPFYFIEAGTKTEILVTEMSNSQWQNVFASEDPWDPVVIGTPLLRGPITGSLVGATASE
jgi:hypothetical protein